MNGEILNNIWSKLSEDNLVDVDFDTWQKNFVEDPEVANNVYNYLVQKNLVTANPDDWVKNINEELAAQQPEQLKKENQIKEEVETEEKPTGPLEFSFGEDEAYTREQILLQNVEIQEDGSTKTSINKDFFNQEDEDAAGQLRAQFGDAYNFEEVIFTRETAGGYGTFSAVKVSTKDGKNSKIIELNIDGRGRTDDMRTQKALEKYEQDPDSLNSFEMTLVMKSQYIEKAYQKSYDDLTSFIKTYATEEANTAIAKKEQEIRKANIEFNNYVNLDLEAIEDKYLEENPNFDPTQPESETNSKRITKTDLFTPTTKTTYTPTGKTVITRTGTNIYKQTTTEQPYKEELKLAMEQLGVNNITQEVKDRARGIIVENERKSLKEQKITEVLEELEDGKILPVSLQKYKDDPENLKNILTVGSKMFKKEYAAKLELFENERYELENNEDILKFTALSKKLNNSEYQFDILEGEPTVFLEDGREVPKRLIDQYEKGRVKLKPRYENFFRLQNELIDNRYNIEDSKTQLDLLKRDYNDWERFGVTIGTGFAELALNIGGATEDLEAHERWMYAKKQLQAKRDEYAKPITYDDAFKSWTNFGKFATVELGNQIPIFATLAVPYAGWGTLLASSFGEQYGEMTAKEIESDGKIDYSLFRKIGQSAGYAVPELAFELVTTVPLLRGAGNALKGMYGSSIRDLTFEGVKQGVKSQTPRFITGSLAGSAGEGGTTLTQNIVTGRPWYENVEHSMFSGLMFETTLAGTPVIAGAITNTLSDYTLSEEFRNNLKITNKLVQDNKNLDTKIKILEKSATPEAASKIEQAKNDKLNNNEKIKELANANETILKNQKETITGRWLGWESGKNKNGMSENTFKRYLEVTNQQEQLRIKAEEILNNKGLSQEEKNRKLKDLKENGFTDSNGKKYYGFDFLQEARDSFRNEKNNEWNLFKANKNNKKQVDKYLNEAQVYIDNIDSDKTPGWVKGKEKDDVARILFNINKINENLGIVKDKKGRPTNLEKDLSVYQTVEDAVSKMTKLGVDSKDIQKIKDGSHGFDIEGGPNKGSYIIVENMAKDDRLETKTHELSHRFFRNAIAENPEAFREISQTIFKWAKDNDKQLFNRLIGQALMVDSAPDEIIAVFLEEAAAERINLKKKGIAGIIGYMTGNVMQEGYGVDMDFAGESDAIKMLIGLGKKIKAGTLTLKDQEAIVKNEVFAKAKREGKFLDLLMPKVKGAVKMSKAVGSQTTVKEDLFKETNNALIEALEMYGMENPERLLSEDINVRKELAKEWEALGDSRFWIGTVIGEKWRRFVEVNYLQKRDKAANYNLYKDQILDVVTTGIEKGDNGIPFLVRSWKPAEEGGRTLTSHIFGEVKTRLMAEGGIIDRKFPQFDKFISTIDMSRDEGGIDVAGDLDIETVLETEKIKKKRKQTLEEDRYRKLIGIDDKFATEIKNIIKEVLLTGDLGLISDFAWTQRFSKAAQKKLFKIIKNEMKDYEAFLKKTRKPFVKHAHTSDLVQMEKNEKNKIFAKLKAVNASPEKIKIALLEGLIQPFEVKSMTQGPNIYEKVDTKEQEFIDFMKVRGRKDAFVKNNINIMAMDAVFDVLLNETIEVDGKQVRVLDEFIRQQREKGLPHVSNVLSIVKERINRDQDVKFSSTVRGFNPLELRVFYGKLDAFGEVLDATNVGDEAAVYQAVYSIWGDDYNQTKLKALSNDLFKLVKRYATIDKNHTNLKTQPEQKLNEYLYKNIKAAELEVNLAEFLNLKNDKGKFIKLSNSFDEIGRINNARNVPIVLGKDLVKKYGKEKALMMMVHASGMYATSTKIGRGKFKVNKKGLVYEITPKDIGKEKFGDQRYQVFDSKKDFNKNVLKKIFPELQITDAGNLKKFQILDGVVDKKGKAKKIDISLLAEKSKEAMQDRDFEARKAQAKLSEEFVKDIAQHYKDQIKKGALDKIDFGMLMMSMASNMQSPLKRAANLKYIYKDKKGKKYKGELRYEHMIPTNYMVMKITDAYMNDGEVDLDALFEEYTVAVIPTTMDDILEEMGYQYVMPIGFEVGQSARVRYYNMSTYGHPDLYSIESLDPKDKGRIYGEGVANIKFSESFKAANTFGKAVDNARSAFDKFQAQKQKGKEFVESILKKPKGITVLDFDDTLATTESLVKYTTPEGKTGSLNAEQYASTYEDLLDKGYTFDFSDFNKVVKGKLAPLFNKAIKLQGKFGPKNMFVLTARPPAAQKPIFDFLKANGLNIPLENITGLGNSTSEAKALWIADKVADGYNDFYFADDALQNVQAVDNMLSQFDVKRKVQQAKVKFSKGASKEFNDILEQTKGLPSDYMISQAKARQRGKRKGLFQFFVPPSADDFAGLLQMFQGKGKQGMEHAAWFKKNLLDPFARGDRSLNGARQRTAEEFKALRKKFPQVSKKLRKVIPTGDYTFGDAIRVYLWDKNDIEVPGLTKTDKNNMLKLVQADPEIQAFADVLGVISRKEDGYIAPDEYWMTKDIVADITEDGIIGDGRKDHLAEWIENKDLIFTPENLNKIEFLYGSNFREALEDILYRMENGTSRPAGSNRIVNNFLNWMNGGISVVMNWNTRSAVLQTLSTVNFINWGDNNILAAGKAFANQKQYWKDFAFLFNSDMLKQRRAGLKTTIESRELMSEVEGAVNPVRAAIRYLLRIGFTPTKFADSFAIASGGATFYRNRINTYKKQGYNQTEAEAKAFIDFQETAEEGQQSSRPDRLSQQQTSVLGRLILAFQNTPMQYVRMSKKEILDLVNGRFTGFTGPNSFASKTGKIMYYTAVQNLIFYSMQTALFAAMFSDEEDDEEFFDKKTERIFDNMADGVLRGMGVSGAVVSTLKNIILKYIANKDSKMYDESAILMEGLKLSPPLSIKARQLLSADKTMRYNRDVIKQMETFDIDNPMWNAAFNVVEMTTNAPLSRMESKYKNVRNALDNRYETWQRVAFMLGYNTWSLGVKNEEIEAIKKEIKAIKTYERKKKAQEEKQAKQAEKQALINKDVEKEKKLQEEGKLKDPKCRHVNTKGERCSVSVANAGDLCTIHEEVLQRTDGKKTRCKQVKADGKRCGMQTSNKSGYCYYHD